MDDRRMVLKDPVLTAKKMKKEKQRSGGFVSDELYFNDDFQDSGLAYGDDYRSSNSEDEYGRALVPARSRRDRGADNPVLSRALDRIQRAKVKGKASVSLTHEELAALERRNSGPSDAERPRSSRHKPRREDSGSSSNTSPNNGSRSRHKKQSSRSGSGFFGGGSNSPRPTSKRSSKGMRSETEGKSTAVVRDDTSPRASRVAPVSYYNSRSDRRAASGDEGRRKPAPSLRERYSDEQARQTQPAYRAYNPNMSAPRDRDVDRGYRSDAAGYRTSADPYRNARPPYPVPDSVAQYEIPDDDYLDGGGGAPPAARLSVPPAHYSNSSRRIVSGPADINFGNVLRRVPVGGRGDASARRMPMSGSDPSLDRRRMPSPVDDESDDESEDEEDDVVRPRVRRQGSGTPPVTYTSNGVGRTRSGSTGWARRKR